MLYNKSLPLQKILRKDPVVSKKDWVIRKRNTKKMSTKREYLRNKQKYKNYHHSKWKVLQENYD